MNAKEKNFCIDEEPRDDDSSSRTSGLSPAPLGVRRGPASPVPAWTREECLYA